MSKLNEKLWSAAAAIRLQRKSPKSLRRKMKSIMSGMYFHVLKTGVNYIGRRAVLGGAEVPLTVPS